MDTLLALDQGTTSTRAYLFDKNGQALFKARRAVECFYPKPGWVEQNPEQLYQGCVDVLNEVINQTKSNVRIKALGITNQRETTVIWDTTGKPIYPAIVWQDRRTEPLCKSWSDQGLDALVKSKTGLLIDPYFSASKIIWILNHVEGARERAQKGELLFGTIDSFLIWRLTKGQVHATDMTNASRTLLFNLEKRAWDSELCQLFDVPMTMLPDIKECADDFGIVSNDILEKHLPIRGVAGDQQAATIGQGCLQRGDIKSTYGTGCFILMNTEQDIKYSSNQLLTTLAYQVKGVPAYALEGSLFMAGSIMQWLRDELGLLVDAESSSDIAYQTKPSEVVLVPAFNGLGAPFWDPKAKGAILNLSRGTHKHDIIRAALEVVCFQTKDLLAAFKMDSQMPLLACKVDGGMAGNDWLLDCLSHGLELPVSRPKFLETTVLGAAFLAGLGEGVFSDLEEIKKFWHLDQCFMPHSSTFAYLDKKYSLWKQALTMISPQAKAWYQNQSQEDPNDSIPSFS